MDFMVYLAIFSDILLSFLRDGCLTRKEFSTKQCSIAVISLFVIIGVTYLIIGCTIPFLCIRKCNCKLKIQEFAALIIYIIQLIAGFLYYVGDNLDGMLIEFGSHVNCNRTCMTRAYFADSIITFMAALLFVFLLNKDVAEGFIKLRKVSGSKEKDSKSNEERREAQNKCTCTRRWRICKLQLPILVTIRQIPKLNIIYSAITLASPLSNSTCETFLHRGSFISSSWIYLATLPITIFSAMLALLLYHWCMGGFKSKYNCIIVLSGSVWQVINIAVVSALIGLYVLADNLLPLNCISTSSMHIARIRVGLWSLVVGLFLYVFTIIIVML